MSSEQGFDIETNDEEPQYKISLLKTLYFLGGMLVLFGIFLLLNVVKNPEIIKKGETQFSGENAFDIWGKITTDVTKRPMSSIGFNQSYDFIHQTLLSIEGNYTGEHNLTVKEQNDGPIWNDFVSVYQNMRDARNLLFYFGKKNTDIKPLIISAHIDSKNTGQGAYDDAAGIAAMLELASLLTRKPNPPSTPVLIAFIGTEELGLHGSKALVKSNVSASGFLNIESLGPGLPLVLLQRGNGSSEVVRAWCTKAGMPVATMINDLIKLGIISSTSDSVIYKDHGIAGAEALFMGNPTKYHTKLDSIGPAKHIQYLGNALESLVYSFDGTVKSHDSVAIGLSPFVIHMSTTAKTIFAIIVSIGSLFAIGYFLYLNPQNIIPATKTIGLLLGSFFIALIIMMLYFVILYYINSLSYAPNVFICFLIISLLLLSLMIIIINCFRFSFLSYDNLKLASCIIVTLLLLIMCRTDFAFVVIWICLFMVITLFTKKYEILSIILCGLSLFPLSYLWFTLSRSFFQYTALIKDMTGELIPPILTVLLLFFVIMSLIPYGLIDESQENWEYISISHYSIVLLILLSLFIKKNPYSTEYNVPGTLSHLIDGSTNSNITFVPICGSRSLKTIKKYMKDSTNVEIVNDFLNPLTKDNLLLKQVPTVIPSFISSWPSYSITEVSQSGGIRNIRFSLLNDVPNLHQIALRIKCPEEKCLISFDSLTNFSELKAYPNTYFFRSSPAHYKLSFDFQTKTGSSNLQVEVFFTYLLRTEEMISFESNLPDYAIPFDKMQFLADTTLMNKTFI